MIFVTESVYFFVSLAAINLEKTSGHPIYITIKQKSSLSSLLQEDREAKLFKSKEYDDNNDKYFAGADR